MSREGSPREKTTDGLASSINEHHIAICFYSFVLVDQPISAMDAGSLDTQTVTPDAQTNETEFGKSIFLNYILFYLLFQGEFHYQN